MPPPGCSDQFLCCPSPDTCFPDQLFWCASPNGFFPSMLKWRFIILAVTSRENVDLKERTTLWMPSDAPCLHICPKKLFLETWCWDGTRFEKHLLVYFAGLLLHAKLLCR